MIFKKRGRSWKYNWKWGQEVIESVKECRYLWINLCNTNSKSNQMRKIGKKATRKFGGNVKNRLMLFDEAVKGIIMYEAEI